MKNITLFLLLILSSAHSYAATVTANNMPYVQTGGTTPKLQNSPAWSDGTNVGIGSTTPSQVLDVNGTVRATVFTATGSGVSYVTGNLGVGSVNPGNSLIVSTGNVGIGSPNPGGAIDVNNGSICLNHVCDSTWPSGLWTTINTNDVYEVNSSTFGNVAIGTSLTSNARLTVVGGNIDIGTSGATSNLVTIGSTGQDIITSVGNIGINTATAGNSLVVNGAIQAIGTGQTLVNNGFVLNTGAVVTNSGSTLTLTAANLVANHVFQETGTTAATFTMDTGSAISSAFSGIGAVAVGYTFYFMVSNASTQTITMASATGATLANVMTVTTLQSRTFACTNTGSNTWSIY